MQCTHTPRSAGSKPGPGWPAVESSLLYVWGACLTEPMGGFCTYPKWAKNTRPHLGCAAVQQVEQAGGVERSRAYLLQQYCREARPPSSASHCQRATNTRMRPRELKKHEHEARCTILDEERTAFVVLVGFIVDLVPLALESRAPNYVRIRLRQPETEERLH